MISIFRPGLQKMGTTGTQTQTHTHTHTQYTHVDTNKHIQTLTQKQVEQRHSLTQKKQSQVDLTTQSGKSGMVEKKILPSWPERAVRISLKVWIFNDDYLVRNIVRNFALKPFFDFCDECAQIALFGPFQTIEIRTFSDN